jgi:two-component system, NtrC family, nitrogen regulation sensor histidine kinase NtrY
MVAGFNYWFQNVFIASLISAVFIFPLAMFAIHAYMSPINRILRALNDGFQNFLDNDFSVSLAHTRNDEIGDLVNVYNKVGEVLRHERLNLYQRELLLDTVIQSTPLALVLVDDSGAIIYSNSAAKQLVNAGKAINGLNFERLLENKPRPFSDSVKSGLSGLFTLARKERSETYHLTQSQFLLNGRIHQLYLFKSLTKEINRQEVNTWKKVIRLISHELNNSLAPITSLAHSGCVLSQRQDAQKLADIFTTMGERARYLQSFIEGYAKFARLPNPQCQIIDTCLFLNNLQQIQSFHLACDKSIATIYADPAQLQQVLINLIKNAHEASEDQAEVTLSINAHVDSFEIQVKDRGKGMSERNLSNALLPFYSTKTDGTGLGLPLCREIVEAHGGKISIANREAGGLKVSMIFPNKMDD